MHFRNADPRPATRRASHRHARWCVLLVLCASTSAPCLAAHDIHRRLNVDVFRDRLTLKVTGYPQVYLHGEIDAHAPQRFRALMKSGRIPAGSDIYLNAPGGDLEAGMALGRMFRAGGMATHMGTPRQPKHASVAAKTAVCLDACVYAWLGGLYRWAPSGRDRIGFTSLPTAGEGSSGLAAYLADMQIDAAAFPPAATSSRSGRVWMTADRMKATGLANNGRLPLSVTYNLSTPAPTLELRQVGRKGTQRVTIQCRPGETTVTAYDEVGSRRARQIAARRTSSYFQLDDTQVLSQPSEGAAVVDNALMIRRSYPPAEFVDLVSARSFGAWVDTRGGTFRDGFSMPIQVVYKQLKDYFYACWRAAPWPPRRK